MCYTISLLEDRKWLLELINDDRRGQLNYDMKVSARVAEEIIYPITRALDWFKGEIIMMEGTEKDRVHGVDAIHKNNGFFEGIANRVQYPIKNIKMRSWDTFTLRKLRKSLAGDNTEVKKMLTGETETKYTIQSYFNERGEVNIGMAKTNDLILFIQSQDKEWLDKHTRPNSYDGNEFFWIPWDNLKNKVNEYREWARKINNNQQSLF